MAGIMITGKTRYPQAIMDKARELWAQKVPPSKIAAQLGISSDVIVRRWCDEEYRQKYNLRAKLKARGEL